MLDGCCRPDYVPKADQAYTKYDALDELLGLTNTRELLIHCYPDTRTSDKA